MMRAKAHIYPYLIAAAPIIHVFSLNYFEISVGQVFTATLISFILTSLFYLAAFHRTKSRDESAILTSILIISFFTYGELRNVLRGVTLAGLDMGKQRIVLILWGFLTLGSLIAAHRFKTLHQIINILFRRSAQILVAIIIISTVVTAGNTNSQSASSGTAPLPLPQKNSGQPRIYPDIYYIILDGYARQDILSSVYNYDNSPFITWLKQKGFYVAEKSTSNYSQTLLSLPSSLNFDYLPSLLDGIKPTSRNTKPLENLIKRNQTAKNLKQLGYMTVNFASGWHFTEIQNSDIYKTGSWQLSEFQHTLLNMTPIPVFFDKIFSLDFQYNSHRKQILFTLEQLANRPATDKPIFVFAHIIAPHPPFVFDEKGQPVRSAREFSFDDGNLYTGQSKRTEYLSKYPKQLAYISKKIMGVIDKLLSDTAHQPVIILQGDHGPGSQLNWDDPDSTNLQERMSILNAYYFPDNKYTELYPAITPVNSFRVVLNHFFGFGVPYLPDESYFSSWRTPYSLIDVTAKVS